MSNVNKIWTEADDKLIIEMLDAGKRYGEIAAHFDVTRNSLISRANRHGFSSHNHYIKLGSFGRNHHHVKAKPQPQKISPRRTTPFIAPLQSPRVIDPVAAPVVAPVDSQAVSYDEYDSKRHCGWPVQDAPIMMCGAVKLPGRSEPYCQFHHDKASQPARTIRFGFPPALK